MKHRRNRFDMKPHKITREAGEGTKIEGYAVLWDHLSVDMWGWKEEFASGAFSETIRKKSRVISTLEHNNSFLLGSTDTGNLLIRQDSEGLFTRTLPPDTQTIRDLVITPMERGDLRGMSFTFSPPIDSKGRIDENWAEMRIVDGVNIRRVKRAILYETSYVADPAYPDTTAELRSLFTEQGGDFDALERALFRARHRDQGLELLTDDHVVVNRSIELLQDLLPTLESGRKPEGSDDPAALGRQATLRQRLTLLTLELTDI